MSMPIGKKLDYINEPSIGPVFARFFSSGVLRELAHKGHSVTAGRLSRQYHLFEHFGTSISVWEFYNTIFKLLVKKYRPEYIYKNAIAEKILLGKHNLNTAFMLTEFRADNCKADAVVLNGTSHVYEIKSEVDSFDRLEDQLNAYQKIFDYITVVTSQNQYNLVNERIPNSVGILVLADNKYNFRKNPYRKPISNRSFVDPVVIFNSLQRTEYLEIIKKEFGISLGGIPNTQVYNEARKYFEKLAPEIAHDAMVEALKGRHNCCVADFITGVPNSLKAASLSIRLTKADGSRFIEMLHKDISTAFA